jgi:hypothetical protein
MLVGVLALVGCGDSGGEEVTATESMIPRGVADQLADRAEEVARLLDQGDACGAARVVRELRRATDQALADGDVPSGFRSPLEAAVADLEGIECTEGEGGATTDETTSTPTSTETTPGATTGTTTDSGTTTAPGTTTDATPTTED